ncbi:MAG: metal ABC transporter permease [Gemmatimonadota bacterium]
MLDLMIPPIVAALVILSVHAYLGLHVIAREVIFVDLAFAQIAAMGTTVGLLFGIEVGSPLSLLGAFAFTLVGALLFSFTRLEDSPVPQEAMIGITYVVASAAVILIAGYTAEGAEHIKETLTGTLIWVSWPTIGKMAGAYFAVAVFHWVFRRQLLAVTFAPERVRRLRLWDFLFYVSFGVAISFSVEVAGVLMVFSTLVIPAVVAFLYTDRLGTALLLAWVAGAVAIVGGIAASFAWDVATGPLLVCAFGVLLVAAFAVRPLLGVRTGRKVRVALLEEDPAPAEEPTPA